MHAHIESPRGLNHPSFPCIYVYRSISIYDVIIRYELLVKRDQEMSTFIDGFEDTRLGVIDDQKKTKETIVALLEHISKVSE